MPTTLKSPDPTTEDSKTSRAAMYVADRNQATVAMRAFLKIAEFWGLKPDEQSKLLGLPTSTFYKYKSLPTSANFSRDTMERISYILGIYKSLAILLPRNEAADGWVKRPNEIFNGQSALDRMLGGNVGDLYAVRQYLDAEISA